MWCLSVTYRGSTKYYNGQILLRNENKSECKQNILGLTSVCLHWLLYLVLGSFHRLTCRHKEDSCTEDDIVTGLVELAGSYTQATHEEQDDAEDGEDARRSYGSYRWREREEEGGMSIRCLEFQTVTCWMNLCKRQSDRERDGWRKLSFGLILAAVLLWEHRVQPINTLPVE